MLHTINPFIAEMFSLLYFVLEISVSEDLAACNTPSKYLPHRISIEKEVLGCMTGWRQLLACKDALVANFVASNVMSTFLYPFLLAFTCY